MQKDILPASEYTAVMLNINYGHNIVLMGKCRNLIISHFYYFS